MSPRSARNCNAQPRSGDTSARPSHVCSEGRTDAGSFPSPQGVICSSRGREPAVGARLMRRAAERRHVFPRAIRRRKKAGDDCPGAGNRKLIRLQIDLAAKHAREAEDAGAEQYQGSRLGGGGCKVELTAINIYADVRSDAQQHACR